MTEKNNSTEYRVYSNKSDDTILTNLLLDLLVTNFVKKEVDSLANQRDNNIPLGADNK